MLGRSMMQEFFGRDPFNDDPFMNDPFFADFPGPRGGMGMIQGGSQERGGGMMMGGFGGFPGGMQMMMPDMRGGGGGSSMMMMSSSFSSNGRTMHSSSTTARMGPGGVAEIQSQERDSSGRERIMMERRIGEQRRRVEKKRDQRTGDEETNDEAFNVDDEEAFEREFQTRMQGGGGGRYDSGFAAGPRLIQQPQVDMRYAQQQRQGGGQRMIMDGGAGMAQQRYRDGTGSGRSYHTAGQYRR